MVGEAVRHGEQVGRSVGRSVGWADAGRDEREREREGKKKERDFTKASRTFGCDSMRLRSELQGPLDSSLSVCELLGFYLRYMYVETCQKRQRLGSVN